MPQLFAYRDTAGREPFNRWFQDLDAQAAAKVRSALAQLEAGNTSEVKPVGGGVAERRIHWGKGLRVYFAQDGKTIIILLGGGTKATQDRDIERAARCWSDYKQRRDRRTK
jgi:putative addiction module killer protein